MYPWPLHLFKFGLGLLLMLLLGSGGTGLLLVWESGQEWHSVWRSEDGWNFEQIAEVGNGQLFYLDRSVTAGLKYCYFVRTFASIRLPFSNVACRSARGTPRARYVYDFGAFYGGEVYISGEQAGWNRQLESRLRGEDRDPRLDGFVFASEPATWRAEIPDGAYTVHVVCYDANPFYDHGRQWVVVEDEVVIDRVLIPGRKIVVRDWLVEVADGLTVEIGRGEGTTVLAYLELRGI